jgi:hypothetical protein
VINKTTTHSSSPYFTICHHLSSSKKSLVGGFSLATPLKKDGVKVESVGMIIHSQYDGKVIKFHGSSHQQPAAITFQSLTAKINGLV